MRYMDETSLVPPHGVETDPEALLRDARNAALFDSSDIGRSSEWEGYQRNHDTYLAEMASVAAEAVDRPASGMVIQEITTGRPSHFVVDTQTDRSGGSSGQDRSATVPQATAPDMAKLGMPNLTLQQEERLLGVAVRRVRQGDGQEAVTAIEAVTFHTANGMLGGYLLQNVPAAVRRGGDDAPQWVSPGDALLPGGERLQGRVSTNKQKDSRNRSALSVSLADGDERATVSFIRTTLGPTDRALQRAAEQVHKPRRKLARAVGAVAAGLAIVAAVPHHVSAEKSAPITSADAMFAPPTANGPNGFPLAATSGFDALSPNNEPYTTATIDRTRRAFTAYFAGDKTGLKDMAAAEGYHANWLSPEQVAAVQAATTPAELDEALRAALSGTPVTMTIGDNEDALEILKPSDDLTATSVTKFENAKRAALDTLAVVDTFSVENLKNEVGPLSIVIVGSLKDTEEGDLGGVTIEDGSGSSIVAIATGMSDPGEQEVAAHELTHVKDDGANNELSALVKNLSPSGFSYLNPDGGYGLGTGSGKAILYKGMKSTNSGYGQTNASEDAAEDASSLFVPKPAIDTNASPLEQKELAILMSEEQQNPGFIANLLSRAHSTGTPGTWNGAKEAWNKTRGPMIPVGILATASLVCMAASWRRRRGQKGMLRSYAIKVGS